MNAKTFHRLMLPIPFLFVLGAARIFIPEQSVWADISAIGFLVLILYGILGGIGGVLFALKRLHLGCPICRERALAISGGKREIILDCPRCGEVLTTTKGLFGFHYERLADDGVDCAGRGSTASTSPKGKSAS